MIRIDSVQPEFAAQLPLYRRTTPIYVQSQDAPFRVPSREGETHHQAGDFLVINTEGRVYGMSKTTFERTHEYGKQDLCPLPYFAVAFKTEPVRAMQMQTAFRVPRKNGDWLEGQPGDYLTIRPDGGLAVVEREEFERSYEKI